jgi:hypothetical protein
VRLAVRSHPSLWLDDLMTSLIRSIRPYSHHPVSKRLSQQAIAVGLQTTRAETAGTTVNVGNLAIAVLQLEATLAPARRRYMALAG